MQKIKQEALYSHLLKYDIFFIDMYGVLWNGASWIKGSLDTLSFLKQNEKEIIILSNASILSKQMEQGNIKRGLLKDVHYNEIVTSGQVLHEMLILDQVQFKSGYSPEKVYTVGVRNEPLFERAQCELVDNLEKADCIYAGLLFFSREEMESRNLFSDTILAGGKYWATNTRPFRKELQKAKNLNLPMVNCNPDLNAFGMNDKTGKFNKFLTQGTISKEYRELGGEVFEIGKPHQEVYAYALNKVKNKEGKILMVGDTMYTDILGAHQFEIDSLLTLSGNTEESKIEIYKSAQPTLVVNLFGNKP